jgi:hypothetical protein
MIIRLPRPILPTRAFVERATTVLLLGILWSGLAACILGALSYDIAYWFEGRETRTAERSAKDRGPKRHCMGQLLHIFNEDLASGRVGRCNQKKNSHER